MNVLDDLARDDPQTARSGFLRATFSPSENWDDDFEVQPRMPESSRVGHDDATNAPTKSGLSNNAEESWDDAYEDEDQNAAPAKPPRKVDDDEIEDWDSSDNELNDQHDPERDQCTRHKGRCDFDGGFEEEDKTVTARSTTSSRDRSHPILPLLTFSSRTHDLQHPLFPPNPFPISTVSPQQPVPSTSPTLSSFSIPLSSNRASIYSQEPLMPTVSNGSAPHLTLLRAYPQSAGSTPPKKGRRLRKKSRPPEADIYELEDHEPDQLLVSVPESPRLPPVPPSPPRPITPTDAPVSQPTSPSILTRIGSFKRWARRSIGPEDVSVAGSRRKKSSIDPGETNNKTPMGAEGLPIAEQLFDRELRTVSPTPTPNKSRLRRSRGSSASGQKAGWFFHSGGGDKEEVNTPIIPSVPAAAPVHTLGPSPSKRSSALGMRWRRKDKEAGDDEGTPTLKTNGRLTPAVMAGASVFPSKELPGAVEDAYRSRPVSLQWQGQSSHPLQFPRHRGTASVGRNAGNSLPFMVADTEKPPHQRVERPEREAGVRGLMGGVRRLSLVGGAHKRTKSIGAEATPAEAAQNKTSTPGRPRSSTEILQSPKAWVILRSATQGPATDHEVRGEALEEVPTLLPPVELDSPSPSRLAQRDLFPWDPYDPISSMSPNPPNHESPIDFTVRKSMVAQSANPPPTSFDTSMHRPERLSSTSTTSLVTGSQPGPAPVSTTSATPSLSSNSPISPDSSHGPALPILPPPSSPRSPSIAPPAMYTASLGRSTVSPAHPGSALRRNSLGDFKMQTPPRGELRIPARISRAQQGLRRDLGMVREFAACVEQLKQLQGKYNMLIDELRTMYESSFPNLRSMSPPVQYHLPSRPSSRPPSQTGTARRVFNVNQNPSLQSVTSQTTTARHDVGRELLRLEHEYGIWWECAELLVELGGGSVASSRTASNPNLTSTPGFTGEFEELPNGSASRLAVASVSEPGSIFEQAPLEKGNGPPQASPPQWRASTGRHDLSARQLRLLRDMLNTPDPASLAYSAGPYGYGAVYPSFPYSVEEGKDPPWNPSNVTLPSEESSTDPHPSRPSSRNDERRKKWRTNRLGLLGLRELLRGLKRNAMAEGRLHGAYQQGMPQRSESSASNSTDDYYNRRRSPWHQHDEHHKRRNDDYPPAIDIPDVPPIPHKSPRRPSLASIFRLGQASKNGRHKSKERPSSRKGNAADDESHTNGGRAPDEYSDWERMSQSDVDLTATAFGSGTIRGRRKPPLSNFSSNPSLLQSHSPTSAALSSPRGAHSASQTSLLDTSPSSGTSPRQSNFPLLMAEEQGAQRQRKLKPRDPQSASWTRVNAAGRPGSRNGKAVATGTVRSAPPADLASMPDPKLALTPETIKPLLEYAKEVSVRLGGCIGEVQALLNTAMPMRAA